MAPTTVNCHPHFADGKSEAQQAEATRPSSPSWRARVCSDSRCPALTRLITTTRTALLWTKQVTVNLAAGFFPDQPNRKDCAKVPHVL